jgi:post-segregation antitoxin (ccd killing protein)
MTIVYQHKNADNRYKLTLRLSAEVVEEAKARNFNISQMVEQMLIEAIEEHDDIQRSKNAK